MIGRIRSLRGRLLAVSLLVLGGGLLLTAVAVFMNAHHEIDELFDAQLAQMARTVAASGVSRRLVSDTRHRHDYERQIGFALFDAQGALLQQSEEGLISRLPEKCGRFRNLWQDWQHWRMFCYRDGASGNTVLAWQSHAIRNELSGKIAISLAAPLLIVLPVLALLIWLAGGRILRPVAAVSGQLAQRNEHDLTPVAVADAPQELQPLIDTANQLLLRIRLVLDNERRFTADAAHELRTPLAGVRIQLEVAQAQLAGQPSPALDKALLAVDRANGLVAALLQLARLEALQQLQWQEIDPAQLCESIVAEAAGQAAGKGMVLQMDCLAGRTVPAEPELLAVALRNLVDNALKYSPAGSVVQVGWDGRCLFVCDQGPGIDAAQREHLLQRFARGRDVTAPGHGLGLSIVMRICELHRARLALDPVSPAGGLRAAICLR